MSSIRMKIVTAAVRLIMCNRKNLPLVRRKLLSRAYPVVPAMPATLRRLCSVGTATIAGAIVYTLTPSLGSSGKTLIYTHGGSYVYQLQTLHWKAIERIIRAAGISVVVPIYPLAPEATFDRTYTLLEGVYRDLLTRTRSEDILLMGDSAGGGLALGQALRYMELGLPLPGRIILLSPWVDLSFSNPDIVKIEPRDVMLSTAVTRMTGIMWAGKEDLRCKLLSPISGDLRGLPPIDIVQGTADILFPDVQLLADKISIQGGQVRLKLYEGAFHVFTSVPWLPESRDAMDFIVQTMRTPGTNYDKDS